MKKPRRCFSAVRPILHAVIGVLGIIGASRQQVWADERASHEWPGLVTTSLLDHDGPRNR